MDQEQPSTSGTEGCRKRKVFSQSWLKEKKFKGWLTAHSDNEKAFCTACKKVLACGKSELTKHANRKCHILNCNKENIKIENNRVASLLTKESDRRDHVNEIKQTEIKLSAFYAEHNIALNTLDHMVPLIKEICTKPEVVRDFSLSRRKCTKIIQNVISKRETEKNIELLKEQRFSILIDESTTISNDKVLCILVKYYNSEQRKCISVVRYVTIRRNRLFRTKNL